MSGRECNVFVKELEEFQVAVKSFYFSRFVLKNAEGYTVIQAETTTVSWWVHVTSCTLVRVNQHISNTSFRQTEPFTCYPV